MRSVSRRILAIVVCLVLLAVVTLKAQEQIPAQNDPSKSVTPKERKKRAAALAKESAAYSAWIDEVVYIITPAERAALQRLATNEERDQFIEEFWRRRNPDPDSLENTAREKHYRRIAYANDHFSSGVPGWKTDRGHIYVLWGPPDEVDFHAAGSPYARTPQQGGGETVTYAFEVWRYRHLEDIGDNIELEFVDPTGTGEFHLTMDPGEKDALAHVPGAGPSLSELFGASRARRFSNTNGTTLPAPLGGYAGFDEFENIERFFKVQRPPEHLKDLDAMVTARIVRDQIHMDYRFDFLRVTGDSVLVPITLQVPNRELHFTAKNGVQSAVLNLYGRITTLGGRVAQTFEEVISCDVPDSLFQSSVNHSSIYQRTIPLRSGLYRLDVVVKDPQGGNLGLLEAPLRVPRYEDDKLDASSLILGDEIQSVPSSQVGQGAFVLGSYKVRPRMNLTFSTTEKMGVFLQLYNLQRDPGTHRTNVSVSYRVTKGEEQVWKQEESSEQLHQFGEQITIERNLPLSSLAPGQYSLQVYVIDLLTNQTISRTADFVVKTPTSPRPAA